MQVLILFFLNIILSWPSRLDLYVGPWHYFGRYIIRQHPFPGGFIVAQGLLKTIYDYEKIAFLLALELAVVSAFCFDNGAKAYAANLSDNSAFASQVQDTMALGKLYFVNIKEGEQPAMTALSLFGDRCGTEAFSHKPFSTEGIRSVFELNEWLEFYPEANAASGIKVMVFEHKEDQSFYLKNTLNDETSGYVQECGLNKDPEDETYNWGSFYLHPEEVNPGYYDFVFIFNDKVFATMLTRFFKEDELHDKSDSELEELMSQRRSE